MSGEPSAKATLSDSELERLAKDKYEAKYINRLASVYITKYEKEGHEMAKAWYNGLLKPRGLRLLVRKEITQELLTRSNKK